VRRLLLVAALVLPAPALTAQSRSDELLTAARNYITLREFEKADTALNGALASALYVMDSVHVFVWRGILEHLRGNDSLSRLNFRRVITQYQLTNVTSLDKISPGLQDLFDAEARPFRVFPDSALDQRAAWRSGPPIEYPSELRRRRVSGHALVRAVIDTLGRADALSFLVLESPDPAFDEPLRRMMLAAQFTPAQRNGHAVQSQVSLGFTLNPPALENPTRLITTAREQLRLHRADSALALLDQALASANTATPGERVYALLVQGLALHQKGRDSLAAVSFDAGITGYRDLIARGTDLAPFLKRLADSVRLSHRAQRPVATPFAAPTVVGTVDDPPALLVHPPIRYAPEMQSLRIGGTVIVEATLDTTGRVVPATVKVVQTPNPAFDAESKRVVQAAVYRPARVHGRPTRVTIRQPITFAAY
jgi:TonB family protein